MRAGVREGVAKAGSGARETGGETQSRAQEAAECEGGQGIPSAPCNVGTAPAPGLKTHTPQGTAAGASVAATTPPAAQGATRVPAPCASYPRVGDGRPQLLQVADEAAVSLHVGVLDQLGQVLLAHTWGRGAPGARGGEGCGCPGTRWEPLELGSGSIVSQEWGRPERISEGLHDELREPPVSRNQESRGLLAREGHWGAVR